jgi:predicted RNA binding protein YcfA (HicA-like mRNA interferase family)
VRAILTRLGFTHVRTDGSHELWEHPEIRARRRAVTVDASMSEFGEDLLKSMIAQSGLTREEFYGATRRTAKRINLPWRR